MRERERKCVCVCEENELRELTAGSQHTSQYSYIHSRARWRGRYNKRGCVFVRKRFTTSQIHRVEERILLIIFMVILNFIQSRIKWVGY